MENLLFKDVYIERSHKETDEVIAMETSAFLEEKISFLIEKNHIVEYIYVEMDAFTKLKVEGVCIELDDIFRTYNVMIGLPVQKKHEDKIKSYFNDILHSDELKFAAMFNQNDGLWDINFTLNYVEAFDDNMTVKEALTVIYNVINNLIQLINEK
ncbi:MULTISPECIES: branched-chain amino acid aminotransferase [Sutcliffiella]|uniref:branched-chain amino acid aminotransferase n=1 Tax=Sutcliffiella TaxID=2837511 RepID=UPI0022DE3BCF|nr:MULTISPECIES: branched-chain amino acid aminotransferase [Sutcliffiella]MED4018693.1 branched-chain amino acid aminotransferase [Sutcliffiella cohnii]WBL13105.1 branched-chain amino acid aminotransferase [Sutcliffiella sp. NC1]